MDTSDICDNLESIFPNLVGVDYQITSECTLRYNCIGWATHDTEKWWWPAPGYYWPIGIPRENSLECFELAFGQVGYVVCTNPDFEPGFEKVALYASTDGRPTHAARQLENGRWTSKLGRLEDIEHPTLDSLEQSDYGIAAKFFRRLIPV